MVKWENYENYLVCPEPSGDTRCKASGFPIITRSMARKMEIEALRNELYDKLKRYPLRDLPRVNYIESDDSDEDAPKKKAKRRRRRCYSVLSVFTPQKEDVNNNNTKKKMTRRYSDSFAFTLRKGGKLLDDLETDSLSGKEELMSEKAVQTESNPDNNQSEAETEVKKIFHRQRPVPENLCEISGNRQSTEKNGDNQSKVSKVSERRKSADRPANSSKSTEDGGVFGADKRAKSCKNISRKRKSESEEETSSKNSKANLENKKKSLKRSSKEEISRTKKNNSNMVSENYKKYEQLYFRGRDKSVQTSVMTEAKIISHRRSTTSISSENERSKNERDSEEPLHSSKFKRIAHRRKSDSALLAEKDIKCSKNTKLARSENKCKEKTADLYKMGETSQSRLIYTDAERSKHPDERSRSNSAHNKIPSEQSASHARKKDMEYSKLDTLQTLDKKYNVKASSGKRSLYSKHDKQNLEPPEKRKYQSRTSSEELLNVKCKDRKTTDQSHTVQRKKIGDKHTSGSDKIDKHYYQEVDDSNDKSVTKHTVDLSCKKISNRITSAERRDEKNGKTPKKNLEPHQEKRNENITSTGSKTMPQGVNGELHQGENQCSIDKHVKNHLSTASPDKKFRKTPEMVNGKACSKSQHLKDKSVQVNFLKISEKFTSSEKTKGRNKKTSAGSKTVPQGLSGEPYRGEKQCSSNKHVKKHLSTTSPDKRTRKTPERLNGKSCSENQHLKDKSVQVNVLKSPRISKKTASQYNEATTTNQIATKMPQKTNGEARREDERDSGEKSTQIKVSLSLKKITGGTASGSHTHRKEKQSPRSKSSQREIAGLSHRRASNSSENKNTQTPTKISRTSDGVLEFHLDNDIFVVSSATAVDEAFQTPERNRKTSTCSQNCDRTSLDCQRIKQRRHSEPNLSTAMEDDDLFSRYRRTSTINFGQEDCHYFLTPEILLERMFSDDTEIERSRRELIRILGASTDDSDISSNRSTPIYSSASHSGQKQNRRDRNVKGISYARDESTTEEDPRRETEDAQSENMTKMEHYKKRLIHQHEKPSLVSSPPSATTEEEDDSPSASPMSSSSSVQSNQNGQPEKKKDEVVQSKVARKRAVCRSKFRHQNLELFKLGNSIPTSLCKTKEPYNICAEKNLQMCCQTQQNGKKDDNPVSITDAIINSMEGSKKKDAILWRSISLNNEKTERPKASNVNSNDNKNLGSGRHVLPAIVSEIPERRKSKTVISSNSEEESRESSDRNMDVNRNDVIQKAEPVSINRRKPISKRRKTVIGIENSRPQIREKEVNAVSQQSRDKDILALTRTNPPTELDVIQNSPINLSVKRPAQPNGARSSQVDGNNPYNDPRLKSPNKSQYRKPPAPVQANGLPKEPPTSLPQLQRTAKAHTAYYPNNYAAAPNFPEMQQQMVRLENPIPPPNHSGNVRKETHHQPDNLANENEEVIRTIIQLVKSSMDPNFSIEILLILNKWYMELKDYWARPSISKGLKMSISKTLNDVILYISDKLFGPPYTVKLKRYVEGMMQLHLVPHKELLTNLLPLLSRHCRNDLWMSNFLKLLSHQPPTFSAENRVRNRNTTRRPSVVGKPIPQNPMFAVPPANSGFHPTILQQAFFMPPRGYFMDHPRNFAVQPPPPPPPPYDSFHYKANAVTNPVPANYQQYSNGLVGAHNQQFRGVCPNTPENYQRPESYNMPPSKVVGPERLYLADNRCIPPKCGLDSTPTPTIGSNYKTNDRLNTIPVRLSDVSSLIAQHPQVPDIALERSNINSNSNHRDVNDQQRETVQSRPDISANTMDTGPDPNRVMNRQLSESSSTISECSGLTTPDVEELLRTNVIINKNRNAALNTHENNAAVQDRAAPTDKYEDMKEEDDVSNNISESFSDTLFVREDKSMEITRASPNQNIRRLELSDNSNDIVVERIWIGGNGDDRTLRSSTITRNEVKDNADCKVYYIPKPLKEADDGHEVIMIDDDEDVSVEGDQKMPKPKEGPPKLIKLLPAKRKEDDYFREHRDKRLRRDAPLTKPDEIVVIDDEEKKEEPKEEIKMMEGAQKDSDCNQNYISTNKQNVTQTTSGSSYGDTAQVESPKTPPKDELKIPLVARNIIEISDSPIMPVRAAAQKTPIIEDISSDEESLEPFRLYNTYESKVGGDPRRILENSEVSHCTLIENNVNLMKKTTDNRLETPLVYTRPLTPLRPRRRTTDSEISSPRRLTVSLASAARFEEDHNSLSCHLKVRNTAELRYPVPKPAEQTSVTGTSPNGRTSPVIAPGTRPPSKFRSPSRSVPTSPVTPARQLVPRSVPASPVPPALNDSRANWKEWFNDEQRKGFFNFGRSLSSGSRRQSVETVCSVGSDYCPKFSVEEDLYEIKIDSKLYRIQRKVYERIPKGKLCYIRETNTFIRYFDDNQMELFIRNLNISDGSLIASDLLKQIKGRVEGSFSDIEVSSGRQEASAKSEIITVSKDVRFSAEDFLADPELYVEEVEKVEKYVPRDFYGFYKFVTGYQIVNHHPPISFQTFLTMHNTNGVRGLLKNYVNTLIEGRNML